MAKRRVFTGPIHQELEAAAFDAAAANAHDGIHRVLYLSSNTARQDSAHDAWSTTHPRLQFRPESLTGLVYDCYEQLVGPSEQLSNQVSRRALEQALDSIVANRDWLTPADHASASLISAFENRFARFENVGLTTPDAVREEFADSQLPARIQETTVAAYQAYHSNRTAVLEDWQHTRVQAFDTVISTGTATDLLPQVDCVILSGFHSYRPLEWRFVDWLIEDLPAIATLPTFTDSPSDGVDVTATDARDRYTTAGFKFEAIPADSETAPFAAITKELYRNRPPTTTDAPATLAWRELPTPEREIRYVAREVTTALADGQDPSDLGVVIPGLPAYEEYVHDIFAIYDLPYQIETGTDLQATHTGAFLTSVLELADPAPQALALTELVTNPLVTTFTSTEQETIITAERTADDTRLTGILSQLDAELTGKITTLQETAAQIRTQTPADATATIRDLAAEHGVLATLEEPPAHINDAIELAAFDTLDDVFTSFQPTTATDTNTVAALQRTVKGLPVARYTADGGGIPVMNLLDAELRAFDDLYLVGLTAQHLPNVAQDPAFFDQMVDAHPVLETVDDRNLARYLVATLLANAQSVTLTMPDTDDSEATVQSPLLDELQRIIDIEPTTGPDTRIGSVEDLQRAIAALPNRRAAVDRAGDRGDLSPAQTIRFDRGIDCATNRGTAELTPHDAVIDSDTVDDIYPAGEREPHSASRLERYVNCGFRFYMQTVLDIDEDETVKQTPDSLEQGRYIHDVLEGFYRSLQVEPDDRVDLHTYDRATLEQTLHEVADKHLAEAAFEYESLFYSRWLEQLFAGLASPAVNDYYGSQRPHDGTERGLFVQFLDQELAEARDLQPAYFELPFGAGLAETDSDAGFSIDFPDGPALPVRGYIDRIDVGDGETPSIQLYDYKTGTTPYMTKTTGGTKFQLPMYLLAGKHHIETRYDALESIDAAYYQVKPPSSIKQPNGLTSKFDTQAELDEFLSTVIPARLATITGAIQHGRFTTTLLGAREAGCEYCDYRRACDVRHHTQRDRIRNHQADDDAYVPIRVTDRSLDAVMGGESDDI